MAAACPPGSPGLVPFVLRSQPLGPRCSWQFKGPAKKKKSGTPGVGGWVRVRNRTRVRFFFIVFLNSPHRETPKNVIKKNSKKSRFWIFVRIFCKNFSTRFFLYNVFCSVFELPSLKNTRKRDKTKKVEEKLTSKILSKFWKKVSTWTFCKNIFMVFLNSPCRETPKNVLKKKSRKK
jgi:hypothetical protein